jgi:DNA repair protein RadA/Sms
MAKTHALHRCSSCGATAAQWSGRCGGCGEWNTLELAVVEARTVSRRPPAIEPVSIGAIDLGAWSARPTGIGELDRVLGGGLVPGSVTLLGGEPGIGKSTLLLQALARLAAAGGSCLLVTAEESAQQVRLRAERLGALPPNLFLVAETSLPTVLDAVAHLQPDFLAVDSIQTVADPAQDSAAGSVVQVRHCAAALVQESKQRDMATILVGHVTKEGNLAGPRLLEHVVDTVLSFEGDRHHGLRLLRAVKHRFGSTGELGLFEMAGEGLLEVPDPSGLLLTDRNAAAPGSVVVPAMDGHRPLLVEVQALVGGTETNIPRRPAQGLDSNRVNLLVAVLERRCKIGYLAKHDVYASAVGGVRIVEPAADLGIALAIASAHMDVAVSADLVACGEVGLSGEVRHVSHIGRRLAEASRLGFKAAVVPASCPDGPSGLQLIRVKTVTAAIREVIPK